MKWVLSIHLHFLLLKTAWNLKLFDDAVDFALGERCFSRWFLDDIEGLRVDLRHNVFGQPFIERALVPLLKRHIGVGMPEGYFPKKALALSFHGSTGVGKTLVAQLITKHLLKEGENSKFYHHVSLGRSWLYDEIKLRALVMETVSQCGRALFVFDEIEKMSEGMFEILKVFLDFHPKVGNVDYRKSIFIFISNIGEKEINSLAESFWRNGTKREDFPLSAFGKVLHTTLYNEQSGLKNTNIVKNYLIDLYLPFLPLEKEHIEKCIAAEAKALGVYFSLESVKTILDSLVFIPEDEPIFAYSGCKSLSSLVKIHGHDEL